MVIGFLVATALPTRRVVWCGSYGVLANSHVLKSCPPEVCYENCHSG